MSMKSKNKKSPGWKSDATKDKIRKAALVIFAKKGFAAASTRMIASRAKMNIALISRYFGGKKELFKYVVQEEVEKVIESELDYPPQGSLKEEVLGYLKFMFSNSEANIDFFRIVVGQSLVDREFSIFLKESILPKEDSRLRARLDQLKEKNLILSDTSPHDLCLSVMAFVTGHILYSFILVTKSKNDLEESIESFLNIICRSAA